MNLVPVPIRQFKTWSMWILIAITALNFAGVIANYLNNRSIFSPETFALVNGSLAFLGTIAKLIQQQIKVTSEQKLELIEAAAATPVKTGEVDIAVDTQVSRLP